MASSPTARVLEEIRSRLGDIIESIEEAKGFVTVYVSPDKLRDAASALKQMGFDHVKSVTVVDRVKEKVFHVGYHVSSYSDEELAKVIVELAVRVPRVDEPVVPSLSGIWPSAEFQEREVYEFFGIVFEGHPDLRPILLAPDVAEKRPLRKEFVVKEEGIYLE